MKKLYFLAASLFMSATIFGQTNLSFEDWDTGHPVDWDYYGTGFTINQIAGEGDAADNNGDPVVPVVEMTDVPTDGNSYARLTSFELTNSSDPQNIPNADYGGVMSQEFASTDKYEDMSIDVKHDIVGSDQGIVLIQALDDEGDAIGQGFELFEGTETDFATYTIEITYFESDPVEGYEIIISSSVAEVFGTIGGNPVPDQEPGSQLDVDNIVFGDLIQDPPNVSNVVASVVGDNCDGSDLRVNFEVPGDESDIANYYVLVTTPGINPALLADPLAVFQGAGVQLTPDGADQEHTFAPGDEYFDVNAGDFELIGDDENLVVHVLVEGETGFSNVFAISNEVNLDCGGTANLLEADKNNMRIFPNPASENVSFDFGETIIETITVSSMNGQTVATINPAASAANLDVTGLENGVYLFNAVDNAGNIVKTDKFVVSH